MENPTRIQIIYDRDSGAENEGWFIRRWFADNHHEDEVLGYVDLGSDAADAELAEEFLFSDEADIPLEIIRG